MSEHTLQANMVRILRMYGLVTIGCDVMSGLMFLGKEQRKRISFIEHHKAIGATVGKGDMEAVPRSREELSDVIISYIGLLRYPKVLNAVKAKMKKNIKRTWKDGQHIEENGHDAKH